MAGRKITQLPTLTTPESTDKLVIVDVSDTTESPQGTSKQIAVSNLGLSSIESTTLDVSIADGVATVDSGFVRSVFLFAVEKNTATLASQINKLGGTFSLTNYSDWTFELTRTGGDSIEGIAIGGQYGSLIDTSTVLPCVMNFSTGVIEIGTSLTFTNPDGTALPDDGGVTVAIYLDNYINGWDV